CSACGLCGGAPRTGGGPPRWARPDSQTRPPATVSPAASSSQSGLITTGLLVGGSIRTSTLLSVAHTEPAPRAPRGLQSPVGATPHRPVGGRVDPHQHAVVVGPDRAGPHGQLTGVQA